MNASNWFKFTAGIAALVSITTVVAPAAPAHAADFSSGSLVVERIGDGSTTLSNASAAISVLEVTTSGSLSQTITLPSSGTTPQTDSGSATSNGYLNTYFSGGVGYVSVPGLNLGTGTASAAGLNVKVNSTLDATGNVINRTLFPTGGPTGTPPSPFSGNNYRSSIATSGSTFYGVGASSGSPSTGGAWYFDGSAFTQVSSTAATVSVTNLRTVEIYNNQLYFASSSGTFLGVSSLGTGLPTSGPALPTLQINAGAGASTYGFVMFSTGSQGAGVLDLAYLADDRTVAGGGIQKYSYNGTAWSNSWSLLVGASGTSTLQSGTGVGFAGIRGLAGTYDSVLGASLYATTTELSNNRLISIFDSGSTTPSTYTTLQSAGSNFFFRGVDLSPVAVPEPSTYAIAAMATLGMANLMRRRRRAGDSAG